MNFLKAHWKQIAIATGASCAAVVVGALVYRYYRKKTTVVEDIAYISDDAQSCAKAKLKQLLRSSNVHCADLDKVEEIIDYLIIDGADQLQIVADFDQTLTAYVHNNSPVPCCHAVVESCPNLPGWFKDKSTELRNYYIAIEIDPHLSREEKYPFMVEWWEKAHELLVSSALKRDDIVTAVRSSNLYLRVGSEHMLSTLSLQKIPLLIFSAGVGDVIDEVLRQRYTKYDNIHVISNWMEFNHEGTLVGFKGENIHVFNKNTHAIENASYFETIKERHNVVLLGDSLGDLDISEGIPHKENLLTIGYLNHHPESNLPAYMRRYDIVLVNEKSVDLFNCLVENIVLSRQPQH